ncbi:hypothetical protein D3C71_836950 [compost metagenome]
MRRKGGLPPGQTGEHPFHLCLELSGAILGHDRLQLVVCTEHATVEPQALGPDFVGVVAQLGQRFKADAHRAPFAVLDRIANHQQSVQIGGFLGIGRQRDPHRGEQAAQVFPTAIALLVVGDLSPQQGHVEGFESLSPMAPDLLLLPSHSVLFCLGFVPFIVEGVGPRDAPATRVEREIVEANLPPHLYVADRAALPARLQPNAFQAEAALALGAGHGGGGDAKRVAVVGEKQVVFGQSELIQIQLLEEPQHAPPVLSVMPHPFGDDVNEGSGELDLDGPPLAVPLRLHVGLAPLHALDVPPPFFQLGLLERRISVQAVPHPPLERLVERALLTQPKPTRQDGLGRMSLAPCAGFAVASREVIEVEAELGSGADGFGPHAHGVLAIGALEPRCAVEHLQFGRQPPIPDDLSVIPAFHEGLQRQALAPLPIPDQIVGSLRSWHVKDGFLHGTTLVRTCLAR